MKLSDIKGERTLDVIASVIDPIANIAEDADATELFTKKAVPEGVEPKAFFLQRVRKSIPLLLKTHKQDLISILAAIEGIEEATYRESLNLVKLTRDCMDILTDDAFSTLFISAQPRADAGTSGSAPESTAE